MSENAGILGHIRVLDFGRFVAGPYTATVLGDLGAEVIRIEPPEGGGDRFTMPLGQGIDGANYVQLARNKKSLVLDFMEPEGRAVLRRLLATADVVVVNVPAPLLKSMGLDYETLRSIKPDIILAVATAYGSGGPYSDRPGFDAIGQCMSGAVHATGLPDLPIRAQAAYCDYGTALYLAVGIMAALMERSRSGKGQQVEASLLHTGLAFIGHFLLEQAMRDPRRERTVNRGQTSAPADLYKTRDGWIVVFAMGNSQFRRIATLVGHEEWLDDPRFVDDPTRGRHGEIVSVGMSAWCATRTNAEALAELEAIRVPCGPLLSAQEALEDPHIRQMGFFREMDYPGLPKPTPLIDLPIRFSDMQAGIRRRAPKLGENTEDVLADLGLTGEEIGDLRAKGIV